MNDDERKKALEKVGKLLRLGTSDQSGEAANALAKAAELANRHGFSRSELEAAKADYNVTHDTFPTPVRLAREWDLALGVVMEALEVEVITESGQVLVVGSSDAVALAEYASTYLVRCSRAAVTTWLAGMDPRRRRHARKGPRKANFLEGFFSAVVWNVRALRRAQYPQQGERKRAAIELHRNSLRELRRDYMARVLQLDVHNLKERNTNTPNLDRRSQREGWAAGEAVNINQPITGEGGQKLLK